MQKSSRFLLPPLLFTHPPQEKRGPDGRVAAWGCGTAHMGKVVPNFVQERIGACRGKHSTFRKMINFKANRMGIRCTPACLSPDVWAGGKARTLCHSCWIPLQLESMRATSCDLTSLLPFSPFYRREAETGREPHDCS